MNHFELPEPSDEFTYVNISFSLSCAYPDTRDGELVFRETTHDHDLRVKVPANYASDKDLVEKYIGETLYDSGNDVATASLYSAEVISMN